LKTGELIYASVPVEWTAMMIGVVLSGISAWLCIFFFLAFIKRVGMMPFVIYRIALGLLLLWLFL
jgi:undecaprenyl-diphosphatase